MTITGNGELMHIWNDPVIVVSMKEDLCFWVEPMSMKSGIIVLCDRKPRHTGKHRHKGKDGLMMQWWRVNADLPD